MPGGFNIGGFRISRTLFPYPGAALSYITQSRVLDLTSSFTSDSTTITDKSGEGNNATLYSGRYASTDGVDDKAIQADATAAGSANYYLTGKVRPTGTSCRVQINDTASGEDDITGLTSGVWQDFTSATFSAQTPSNIVLGWSSNSGFLAVACDWSDVRLVNATTGATVARCQLNESNDSNLDGYPAIDSSGNGYYGTHTGCAGGTGETTILQTAGMDWNGYRTVKYSNVAGSELRVTKSVVSDPAGGSPSVTKLEVTTSGSAALVSVSSLIVGRTTRVSLEVYAPSSNTEVNGIWLSDTFGVAGLAINGESVALDQWVTVSGTGVPATTDLRIQLDNNVNGNIDTIGAGGVGDVIYVRNLQVTDGTHNYLIPESDSTAGEDALGNSIANPRPTADTFNGFSTSEYLQIPDDASLESVRSITVAIYNDGTTRDFVQAAGGASFVHSAANVLTTDQTGTHAYYVNGVATTTLAAGWNIVGIVFDAGKDLSGGKMFFESAKLLAYDPTALTADQQLQNFNAFKSQFGL